MSDSDSLKSLDLCGKNLDTSSLEYLVDWRLDEKFKYDPSAFRVLTPSIRYSVSDPRFAGKASDAISEIIAGDLFKTVSSHPGFRDDDICAMSKTYLVKDDNAGDPGFKAFAWIAMRRHDGSKPEVEKE